MRIAIISDSHLGYQFGTERGEDAFNQFEEAIDDALARKCDLILLPGDIFNDRVPGHEVLAKAMKILQKPKLAEKSPARLVGFTCAGKHADSFALSGIPVIAIHGTHERRSAHSVNAVELLEQAHFLIHLNNCGVTFGDNGEKVLIQGFSGVPDNEVRRTLEEWQPKPEPGCVNLFVFHQSLTECIYSDDETPLISIADLPKGFDLYVCGHVHWSNALQASGKLVLFPGSTVITQQKNIEAEKRKGFFMVETKEGKVSYDFIELKKQRPFYFRELSFDDADATTVVSKARAAIEECTSKQDAIKPLVRIKLTGTLKAGEKFSNEDITKGFDSALASVSDETESANLQQKIAKLREMQQNKLSVDERGMQLLSSLLKELNYNGIPPSEILDALAEGDTERAMQKVLSRMEKITK